jgi:thiol:disulfide interchange protein
MVPLKIKTRFNHSFLMKKVLSTLLLIVLTFIIQAQIVTPIKWSFNQQRKNDSTEVLIFTATLSGKHHLYSQFTPDGGPLPTIFDFKKTKDFKLIGKTSEPKPEGEYDDLFGVTVQLFKLQRVEFKQEVRILSSKDFKITGEISGMTCDDQGCIPFDQEPFSFDIKGNPKASAVAVKSIDTVAAVASNKIDTPSNVVNATPENTNANCKDIVIEGLKQEKKEESSESYWFIFLLGFGGGLVALLTPCVFPMIPLTVSFFTKSSGTKKKGLLMAITYGLSIAGIYTLLAVPFIVAKVPPDTLNEIATSAVLNIFFFVIFVAFAISFFGYYEISLPSSLANKADNASNTGGFIGVFFMAITLALVSFSCTGPILGSFLAGTLATNPDPYNILFVMLGFGSALGLPFALFAAFPAWLNSLPKSGGWLNSVKVVLGFLELGMALKFLSNADLVEQWGLLKREPFLIIWALIAFALAAYLLGFIKFPHDSPIKKKSPIRYILASTFFAAGVYFTSGLFGNGLELISGFPPPTFYSYAAKNEAKKENSTGDEHCPQGIPCEHDYKVAIEKAKKENKPILIDFTGWACVNCRRMEEGVWVDPEVKKIMSQDYVLVSLYVDEKAELPKEEQFVSCLTGKRVKTVGNKWSNMQVVNFQTNSQPQYITISPEGKLLNAPVGYTSKENYLRFLKEGISKNKQEAALN